MIQFAKSIKFKQFIWIAIVLSVPAFLINLGLQSFIEDESIRALVSLEMQYSGNYITPTLNGSYYYYKPPLYNWIIVAFYSLFGVANEWTARIPTVLFSFLMTWFIYKFNRIYLDKKTSVYIAFAFLTCGRILFWDSFLGLIDICFSLVMYALMVLIYHWGTRQQWAKMYLFAYLMTTTGYMLKGFPSFIFLGMSLLAFFFISKQWKRILHPTNFIGFGLMCGLIGFYYFLYNGIHDASESFAPLLDQSTRRTVVTHKVLDAIKHFFTYPFENLYHFLPWSLLSILFFRKDLLELIKRNQYVSYISLAFIANILVYWISVEVYARYVLMLAPMIFTVHFYLYKNEIGLNSWRTKGLSVLLKVVVLILPLATVFMAFNPGVDHISNGMIYLVIIFLLQLLFAFIYFVNVENRVMILVIMCLIIRLGFDLIIFPDRYQRDFATYTKEEATSIGEKYKGKQLELYKSGKIDYTSSFYLAKARGEITQRKQENFMKGDHYVLDTARWDFPLWKHTIVDSFQIREDRIMLYIIEKD